MIKAGKGPCHLNGNRLYFEDGWEGRLKEIGLLQGSRWYTLEPGTLVTGSVVVNTYRVPLSSGVAIYFKRYVYNNKNRYFLQQSRAANEVYCYQQLADIGIPTLKPLVLGEIRLARTHDQALGIQEPNALPGFLQRKPLIHHGRNHRVANA